MIFLPSNKRVPCLRYNSSWIVPNNKINPDILDEVTVSRKQMFIPWLIQYSLMVSFGGQYFQDILDRDDNLLTVAWREMRLTVDTILFQWDFMVNINNLSVVLARQSKEINLRAKILHLIFNSFRFQFYTPPWTNVRIFYYFLFYSLCVSWYKNIFVESANFIHNNTSQRDWPAWLHNWIRETGWSDYLVCVGMSWTNAQNLLNLYIYYITIWAKWRELSTVRYDK